MALSELDSRILPIGEIWPGMQLKTVKSPQLPLVQNVMMQIYRLEDGPLKAGFFAMQPGEVEPAPKARLLDLPLSTRFEPVEVYSSDNLPESLQIATFANGRSLRYRGSIGHPISLHRNEAGEIVLDDMGYDLMTSGKQFWRVTGLNNVKGDVTRALDTAESSEKARLLTQTFNLVIPPDAFFVPIHRKQMPF